MPSVTVYVDLSGRGKQEKDRSLRHEWHRLRPQHAGRLPDVCRQTFPEDEGIKAEKDLKWSTVHILLMFLLFPSAPLFAGEVVSKNVSRDISNIGFMDNPPKALKETFPMCDAFLKVVWIDKEKKIGYTHYEALLFDRPGVLGKEKRKVWALVKLDDTWPSYTMDIYQYKRQGRMTELFDLVKNGKQTGNAIVLQIKYKRKTEAFYKLISPVLSDHRQTVCIPYPDEQRAWIVEGKSVKHAYSEAQQENLSNRIRQTSQALSRKLLEGLWVLDLNFDGKDDYVFDVLYQVFGVIEYSWIDKVYQVDRPVQYPDYILTFPPLNRTCRLKIDGIFPLTTDGRNFYINNQCNLTKLTSSSEKE